MKVTLLYNPKDRGINGDNWKLNNYRFFRDELPKHVDLDVVIDMCQVHPDTEAVILWSLLPKHIDTMCVDGFEDLKCLKITRAPDAWQINKAYNKTAKELGIDLVVSFQSPKCQYDFLDKDIRYERFVLGIDEETYRYNSPWNSWDGRVKDKILSSGVLDNRWWFYRFRDMVTEHPFVEYIPKKEFLGTEYWRLLTSYRAAIACMSYTSVLKYFEIPMCGCLMFAEVNQMNQIAEMGFEDGVNCVYIDNLNYKQRFKEYMDTVDDPKWKQIAEAGRQHVLDNFTNEREVKRFVKLIESLAAAKRG